jgi:exonuclease SbcD
MKESSQQIITLYTRQGEIGAILCAIPFIRQRDVLTSKAGQSGEEKRAAMQQAITEHYHTLYQQAVSERARYQQPLPIIATGHLVTVGASTTESVREIYIGTLNAFPASGFPPADYIALGHIHKAQCVAKSEHIRYSGSPIPLSFDETGKTNVKSVLLVDFQNGKFNQATPLETPCFQKIQVIKGDLNSIEKQLSHLADTNNLADGQTIWLDIIVSSQNYLNDLQTRIQQLTADLPVEVLLLRRERKSKQNSLHEEEKETLNELSEYDVFERRLATEIGESEDEQQRKIRIKQLFKHVVSEVKQSDKTSNKKGGNV